MDQQIQAYLESLVSEVLQSHALVNYTSQQKNEYAQKLRDHFNNVIFDIVLDQMTPEQLNSIKDIPMESPEFAQKIEEISAQIPSLSQVLEKRLAQETHALKNNPKIII